MLTKQVLKNIQVYPTRLLRDEGGLAAVMVAVAATALISIAALAVDVGHLMITKNELQNIADSTALAAARQLGFIYEGLSYQEQQSYVCNASQLMSVVEDVAANSRAGGQEGITVSVGDVRIGRWDPTSTPRLTETQIRPDAVSVTVRRDATANGPITTFFAKLLGINSIDVSADATAALTGESTAGSGEIELPVAISTQWFNIQSPEFCNQPIKFYPTNTIEGCAGWNTFTESPANASTLRNIIEGIDDGTFSSPETIAGVTEYSFTGGNVANALCDLKDLFDVRKGPDGTWITHVAIYESSDCFNPSGPLTIVGFATTRITSVLCPPDGQEINAHVLCNNSEPGRGGGGNFGTIGTIPGLVE